MICLKHLKQVNSKDNILPNSHGTNTMNIPVTWAKYTPDFYKDFQSAITSTSPHQKCGKFSGSTTSEHCGNDGCSATMQIWESSTKLITVAMLHTQPPQHMVGILEVTPQPLPNQADQHMSRG